MKHWLGVACTVTGLLLARPGHCVDQELREAAVDSLLALDAAQAKHDAALVEIGKARAVWLASWETWEVDLTATEKSLEAATPPPADAIKALKERKNLARQKPDSELSAATLAALGKALDELKEKVDTAQKALAAPDAQLTKILEAIAKTKEALGVEQTKLEALEKALAAAKATQQKNRDAFAKGTGPARFLSERLRAGRQLRCITAYCYGGFDGAKYGIEPVLDLPVGVVWSAGSGALTSYVNSHTVNVEFNAGLRFWLGYDIMSVAVYFSRPLITGNDPIRVAGSSFEHSPDAVRRPFPSIGLGFAGDLVLLGISYDQLRNGATDSTRDPSYPANSVLSRSLTFSLGFSLFNFSKETLAKSHNDSENKQTESAKGGTK